MDEYRRLRRQILELKSFIELQNFSERRINVSEPCGVEDIYNEIDTCNVSFLFLLIIKWGHVKSMYRIRKVVVKNRFLCVLYRCR